MINATVNEGRTYYSATFRGVKYTAGMSCGKWFVASRRLSLGRFNTGGGRYYDTLADVAKGCKAFVGIDLLVTA